MTKRSKLKINLIFAALTAFFFFALLVFATALSAGTTAFASEPQQTYRFYEISEFSAYARAYASGDRNPTDVLYFTYVNDSEFTDGSYVSLGTSDRPFAGTIYIPRTGIDTFRLYNCPLFNYVSTDARIFYNGTETIADVKIIREKPEETPADGVLTSGAVFANHVTKGTNNASWSVDLLAYSGEGRSAEDHEGMIGDIADEASVNFSLNNASALPVRKAGAAGLICGTLGEDASLTVATSGSDDEITVTSTAGNAGGLVGTMKEGATLTLSSQNNSRVASVTGTGYAGGLVGSAIDPTILLGTGVSVCEINSFQTVQSVKTPLALSVSGTTGAGGVFGYYKTTAASETFRADKYAFTGTTTLSSSSSNGCAGGFFGFLDSACADLTFDGCATGSNSYSFVLSSGSMRGGVAGKYKTSALTNAFEITDLDFTVDSNAEGGYSAGVLGGVTANPAYISFHDLGVSSVSHSPSAGLVGDLGEGGCFVEVEDVVVSGGFSAGLIANMSQGVLRIQGETDFSSYSQSGASAGLIVKDRGRALIYALGDGEGNGWTLKRNVTNYIDDISGWGEVLRVDGAILKESDLFTVDADTAHTVTLKAVTASIGTITQFALTALNIQLNTTASTGALCFTSGSANQSATLLSGTLTLTADISLAGTGLTGFTRDNGSGTGTFTGTLNGGEHTVTLATGEAYGLQGDGTALPADTLQGTVHRHVYNGLFAKIGGGASVEDLTIAGSIKVQQSADGMFAGALAAYASGSVTISELIVNVSLGYRSVTDLSFTFGGAIGTATGASLSVSASDCSVTSVVVDTTKAGVGGANTSKIGGFLGTMTLGATDSPSQSVSLTDSSVSLTYTKSVNTTRESAFGGVIASIGNSTYVKDQRTVTLDTVTLSVTATGAVANNRFGGLLGMDWLSCDVTLDDVDITATITATGSAAPFGGLTQTATGRWNVVDVSLTAATYTLPTGGSFGFVANKTYSAAGVNLGSNNTIYPACALYLDVNYASYDIGALAFTGSPSFTVFDELVATSVATGANVTRNGNSVVSVTTSGNVIDTSGSSYNTYLNKTAYGRATGTVNPNTRYYYNLAYARANLSTAKYEFLVWSVGQYAHESLSAWFSADASFTGSLDMTGLSYYPIDFSGSVTFTSVTIKLDNILTESSVQYAYYYDDDGVQSSASRSTRSNTNQHYLMHTSVFRNALGTIVIDGATVQGNVPRFSDDSCGFLVSGALGGSDATRAKCEFSSVTFDGAYISSGNGHFTDTTYAPLIINKVGKNSVIDWAGAGATSYGSYETNDCYAASSLIGDVGDGAARAIYLTFSGLAFDSRTSHVSIDNFDTAYGTNRSIFSRATILNSFLYFAESSGSYNFEMDEDRTSALVATHTVTYGKEITDSLENPGKQKKYYGSEYYVHPTAYQSNAEYSFSSGFRPYVYVAYNLGEYKHELSVNVTFESVIAGCGKYGDPYIIDDDEKLPILSRIIAGTDVGNTVQLYLPGDLTNYDNTGTSYTKYLYNFGTTTFVSSNGGADQANTDVRRYLAGAYFVVTKDVTLPSDYTALGTTTSEEYAFRGVLMGRGNPVITNTSRNPLIYSSNGCVVKDLTVEVDVDYNSSNVIELASPLGSDTYAYSGGVQSYGAVISQIMGGDTFIDNVQVTFTSVSFSVTASNSSHYPTLTPIGGYVGVLVNGGLIFRNMTGSNVGLTASTYDKVTHSGYLYVNPIIGRVIAGYAFNETDTYHATEAASTLKNGEKNYTISNLSLSEGKMTVTYGSGYFTVTVPNGQAMYVLGAIVNSGAASASYHASDVNAYSTDLPDIWSAYSAHTTARAGATYDAVGTQNFASDDDYTDYAVYDAYTADGAKIPYVIRAYTTKSGDAYLARCISSLENTRVVISGDCDVAQGFRGIGSIYYRDDDYSKYVSLGVASVSGRIGSTQTSRTVTLHMRFLEYNHKSVSAYIAIAESGSEKSTAGLGLFNYLKMNGPSDTNSVQYLTLAGSVFYDVYTITGVQAKYNFANYYNNKDRTEEGTISSGDTEDATLRRTLLSVGGVVGFAGNQFYIKNVTFNNFSVEGAKTAGGLVGFTFQAKNSSNISKIVYDDAAVTNAGYINVVGGLQAGGLIGRILRAAVEIEGAEGGTDIVVKDISSKNNNPNETGLRYYANLNTGVGGLIGTCWAADGDGKEKPPITPEAPTPVKRLFINRINVVKGTNAATIRVQNDSGDKNNYAGGFIGSAHNVWIKLTNCNVEGVSVSANIAGGLVGKVTQKYYLYIENCSADGSAKDASVTGTRYAGGAVAWAIGRDALYFQLLDFTTKDYVIQSTTTDEVGAGAGGVVGYAQGDNKGVNDNANYICEFNNLTVFGCDIVTNYKDTDVYPVRHRCGTGGLIGVIDTCAEGVDGNRSVNNKYKFSGYNVLVKNTSIRHFDTGVTEKSTATNNQRIGDIVGSNSVLSPIKMAGVAVQNDNYCGKHVGSYGSDNDEYGTSGNTGYGTGYIVFANFNASTNGTTLPNVEDGSSAADDFTSVVAAVPYVTVNPTLTIGGLRLTGDGVASSVNALPIQSILADTSGKYSYASNGYYTGSSGNTNKQAFAAFTSKISMFSSETSGYLGTDFPVIIADDMTSANLHKMINSYLRLLTNTVHDFGADSAGVYSVVIYHVTYANSTFTPHATGASLKRADGQFYITNSAFDSGKMQFSLIDLRFFKPADGATVAYHVYVPVFVKKVLSYSFDIAAQSGTNYLESHYTDKFGEALIENVGTPVTLFFRYTYSRTVAEWTDAINLGEDVNRNYLKTLYFYKANTNDVLKDIPSDAVLVLVDKNRGGKPYYATAGTAFSGNTLNLSAFSERMSATGVFSGDTFTPVTLGDMMTLTVTQQGGGADKLVECNVASATVVVAGQGYRLATDQELQDNSVQKYTVTASGAEISERYYLSVYTKSNALNDSLFHYFLITTPTSFGDVEHPSKIIDTGSHTTVHLVMGKIFYHDDLAISGNSLLGSQVMTAENNELIVSLKSVLGLSDHLGTDVKADVQNLIGATNVYQSFLLYLTRKEGLEMLRAIIGDPTVTGEYAIDYVLDGEVTGVTPGAYPAASIRLTQNYVEFVTGNISDKFDVNNKFEINATVTLSYGATAIPAQFPGRGIASPDSGVTLSAASNVAFSSEGTTYSKNTISVDETPAVSYYSEADPLVAVLDLNPLGDKVGNFTDLGINALNIGTATTSEFDLLAVIDATAVEEQIENYQSVSISVKLVKKDEDGSYGGSLLDVSEYFTVTFEGEVNAPTDNGTEYTHVIAANSDNLVDNGAEITLPVLHVSVKTGAAFEAAGLTYSNYRLVVETVLYNAQGEIPSTRVSNYVIYTNAKVVPTFVG